jgi:K+-sensing histidine kinase KdpD
MFYDKRPNSSSSEAIEALAPGTAWSRWVHRIARMTQGVKSYSLLTAMNICLAAAVFVLDTLIPVDVADAMLYLAPVAWIALWSSREHASLVIGAATGCTVLAILGFFLSPTGDFWIGVGNRVIAIFVIWTTAILSVLRKQAEEEAKILRGLLPICSYCKKIRDDKGYWEQIEVYVSARSQANFTHGLCPQCRERHYPSLID